MAGNDASHNQDQHHTKVLRALHGEILAYGLSPIDVNSSIGEGGDGGAGGAFSQSASGAFPPLHYTYRPDDGRATREVVIRALAMFDELIVTATVTVSAKEAEAAVTPLSPSAAAASATEICPPSAAAPSRRVTFDITRWLLLGDDKEVGTEYAAIICRLDLAGCVQRDPSVTNIMYGYSSVVAGRPAPVERCAPLTLRGWVSSCVLVERRPTSYNTRSLFCCMYLYE